MRLQGEKSRAAVRQHGSEWRKRLQGVLRLEPGLGCDHLTDVAAWTAREEHSGARVTDEAAGHGA